MKTRSGMHLRYSKVFVLCVNATLTMITVAHAVIGHFIAV